MPGSPAAYLLLILSTTQYSFSTDGSTSFKSLILLPNMQCWFLHVLLYGKEKLTPLMKQHKRLHSFQDYSGHQTAVI